MFTFWGCKWRFRIDETVDCEKGSNAVISYIHGYLNQHSFGISNLSLQANNCTGQNKNFFIFYLVWWILNKMHDRITNNFLLAGHTKFTPDRCFGLIKQNYRRGFVSSIFVVASAVNNSAGVNSAKLCGLPNGEVLVAIYDWQNIFEKCFCCTQIYCHTTDLNFP